MLVDIEIMAHGGSVLEIRKADGKWQVVADSQYARRITARPSAHLGSGRRPRPHEDLATTRPAARSRGMLNNCAGGVTPWGTWLTCEENFNGYFSGKLPDGHPEAANAKRYGVAEQLV